MSRAQRALLGVLLGAILTLFAHPYSRTRLFAALGAWGEVPAAVAMDPVSSLDVLPQPENLSDYSLWMDVGARLVLERHAMKVRDWDNLVTAADRAARMEPDNAFWLQMRAVFLLAKRSRSEAQAAWASASKRIRWDDGQTKKLVDLRTDLSRRYGIGAWAGCVVYAKRSLAPARAIESFARDLARTTKTAGPGSLKLRYATALNGKLVRDFAKSLRVAERGIATIELASYPPDLSSINSPRKLLLARSDFYNALKGAGMAVAAEDVERSFRDNDSWLGYPRADQARDEVAGDAIWALLANCGFGALLCASVAGLALVGIASFLARGRLAEILIGPPGVLILGLILAAAVYWIVDWPLTSLAVAAAAGFLTFTPAKVRTRPSMDLGPFHGFLTSMIGAVLFLALAGLFIEYSTPGSLLLEALAFPVQYFGGYRPPIAVIALTLSILALVSAFYALVHRIDTPTVFVGTLRKLGLGLAWTGVFVAVFGSPFLLLLDRFVEKGMDQRLTNEPAYYYIND